MVRSVLGEALFNDSDGDGQGQVECNEVQVIGPVVLVEDVRPAA